MSRTFIHKPVLGVVLFLILAGKQGYAAVYDLENLPDPTAPLNMLLPDELVNRSPALEKIEQIVSGFKLSTVLIRKNDRVAVINSQRVREGDLIGEDATVVAISNDGVTLDIAGEIRVLSLYGGSIKSLANGESK